MHSRILRLILCLTVALMGTAAISGCGGAAATSISSSESLLDAGLKAFQEKDYAAAETHLAAAIANGHLQPDLGENALRSLAVARIRLDKLTAAESDLMSLSMGAAEMDLYWVACAELELKKGDQEAAKNAAQQAREINPDVELPPELQ